MGCTISAEERAAVARSKAIDQTIKEADLHSKNVVKLLLLGKTGKTNISVLSCVLSAVRKQKAVHEHIPVFAASGSEQQKELLSAAI